MVYSISWGHKMAGLDACPSDHPLVKSTVEGARKILAQRPKLTFSLVQKIAKHYSSRLFSFNSLLVCAPCRIRWLFSHRRATKHDAQGRRYFVRPYVCVYS